MGSDKKKGHQMEEILPIGIVTDLREQKPEFVEKLFDQAKKVRWPKKISGECCLLSPSPHTTETQIAFSTAASALGLYPIVSLNARELLNHGQTVQLIREIARHGIRAIAVSECDASTIRLASALAQLPVLDSDAVAALNHQYKIRDRRTSGDPPLIRLWTAVLERALFV